MLREELAEQDLVTGETIGISVAIIILALVFGAVTAALIPVVLAVASIFVAIGLVAILGQAVDLNDFVPNIMTMMGLAVGIDYCLFILSRYREWTWENCCKARSRIANIRLEFKTHRSQYGDRWRYGIKRDRQW